MKKVAIIGGGATGLSAGYNLIKNGYKVDIFERAPFLGGQASTIDIGNSRLEKGYHHLFTSDRYMVSLIRELGLEKKLVWLESKVGIFYKDTLSKFASPIDLLKFKALNPIDRLRLGLVTLYLQKTSKWHHFEQVSAHEWMKKSVGQSAYKIVWEPLLRGKFGEFSREVSMAWLWNKLRLRVSSRKKLWETEKIGYPMCSFGEVFDQLGSKITKLGGEVFTETNVENIKRIENENFLLDIPGRDSRLNSYNTVIVTTPSYVLDKLIELPRDYRDKLLSAKYLSAVLIILILDRKLSDFYWLNIADRTMPFVGAIEHTNLISSKHYQGKNIVYLTNYPSRDNSLYKKNKEELLSLYLPALKRINPNFDESWILESYYQKIDAAQPVVGLNYRDKILPLTTPIKGLYLANTTQIYPEDRGTNYSVRLGIDVSRKLMENFSHSF